MCISIVGSRILKYIQANSHWMADNPKNYHCEMEMWEIDAYK